MERLRDLPEVRLHVSREVHRLLKQTAEERRLSIADVPRTLIDQGIETSRRYWNAKDQGAGG